MRSPSQNSPEVDVLFTDLDLIGDIHAGISLADEAVKMLPKLKVLYTTGRAITDGMESRFVTGSGVHEKPYTIDQLRTSLSAHFDINPLLRSKRS